VDKNGSRADLVDIGVELLLLDNDNAGLPLVGVLDRNLVQLGHFLLHGYNSLIPLTKHLSIMHPKAADMVSSGPCFENGRNTSLNPRKIPIYLKNLSFN
jgi:hypothetical protein